ncbi:MAG: redox-regulated ATPase YchF [Clostridia bacterium]
MKLGIVGLPNVGKSTLFNAITKAGADSANYPFCTIEPNIGVVAVPDERLDTLANMNDSVKTIYASIDFVDIAGLVKGASKGEGLGNKFLSHIREVDAVVHVVRCFEDENIVHVHGGIDPIDDIETISLELIYADEEAVQKRIDRVSKLNKSGNKVAQVEVNALNRILADLKDLKPARTTELNEEEKELLKDLYLLSSKPVIYVANVAEAQVANISTDKNVSLVKEYAKKEGAEVIALCAKLEEELTELDEEDKLMLMEEYGIQQAGLNMLITAGYTLLGQISYLTTGKEETRAWTITKGTKAPGAAGKIHSDFERGFIKAEIISYADLIKCGTMALAREKGLIRMEGKEYVMQDGDITVFKFNV